MDNTLTPDRLARVKAYMQVYHDDDDELIVDIYDAAIGYLDNAGVASRLLKTSSLPLYNLAIAGLVLNDYDRRLSEEAGSFATIDFGLRRKINQLKNECDAARAVRRYAGEVED